MESFFKRLLVTSAFLSLTACGEENTVSEESSVTESSESSVTEVSSESSSTSVETTSETETDSGRLMEAFAESFATDNYLITYEITSTDPTISELGAYTQTIAHTEGMTAITTDMGGVKTRAVMRDRTMYMIDDNLKQILVTEMNDGEDYEASDPIDTAGFEFVETGREDGLTYEKYRMENYSYTYYFSGDELHRIEIDDGTHVMTMQVTNKSEDVRAEMFELPEGYVEINLNEMPNEMMDESEE